MTELVFSATDHQHSKVVEIEGFKDRVIESDSGVKVSSSEVEGFDKSTIQIEIAVLNSSGQPIRFDGTKCSVAFEDGYTIQGADGQRWFTQKKHHMERSAAMSEFGTTALAYFAAHRTAKVEVATRDAQGDVFRTTGKVSYTDQATLERGNEAILQRASATDSAVASIYNGILYGQTLPSDGLLDGHVYFEVPKDRRWRRADQVRIVLGETTFVFPQSR